MEELELKIEEAKESMQTAIDHLENELLKIRAGKASAGMLEGIFVDYYGVNTPLNQVANISTPDAKTIIIQPWEKNMLAPIEKSIQKENLGLNPMNDGDIIRISIPPLTEERRKEIVKRVKILGENAKVSIRNSRRDINDEVKKAVKDGLAEDIAKSTETEVQTLTDEFTKKVDNHITSKENELLTI
ncbi:MAG: ribosome recycling factor [Chitinophagaceae bacterium]|nr:MAG: ribosome recycling factor [Chitinophagaceae bacterium]